MKKKQKVVRIHPRKKPNLAMPVCPYCGRDAVIRPAEYVYGDDTIIAGMQRISGLQFLCRSS